MDPKILEKIKKCLALSKSPQPGEAAAAMNMAQKLMAQHGVSALDLQLSEIAHVDVRSTASVSKVKHWELHLMNVVRKAFGCKMLWTSGVSFKGVTANQAFGFYTFIGPKGQVELAQYTAIVLLRKLKSARAEFVVKLPQHFDRQRKVKEAEGFCLGWVAAVAKTVHEFAGPKELDDAVEKYIQKNFNIGDDGCKTDDRKAGLAGYVSGQEKGASENLHRPMNERERDQQLLQNRLLK